MDIQFILIIAALSNAIRGGQWRIWLNIPDEKYKWLKSDYINAVIYSLTVFALFGSPLLALAAIPAMMLGATPGWGDYIGALLGGRLTNLKENKFIDPLIKWVVKYPTVWGALGLTIRGFWWGLCLATPFYFLGHEQVAYNFLNTGPLMGLIYLLAGRWIDNRLKTHSVANGWGLGEVLYGVILWSALYVK